MFRFIQLYIICMIIGSLLSFITSNFSYNWDALLHFSLVLWMYIPLSSDSGLDVERSANVSKHSMATSSIASKMCLETFGDDVAIFFTFSTWIFVFFGTFVLISRMRRGIIGIESGSVSSPSGDWIETIWRFL